jgi:hypothetical protein
MPRLTLKNTNASKSAPTNTNTSSGAPTSTNLNNPARKIRRDSARPPLILHLNAKQRKEAEAAACTLRRAQATLESYRQSLDGYAATESEISQPLLNSARAAIDTLNSIAHPGDRARRIFAAAKRAFDETRSLMANDIQRELDFQNQRQDVAEAAVSGVL